MFVISGCTWWAYVSPWHARKYSSNCSIASLSTSGYCDLLYLSINYHRLLINIVKSHNCSIVIFFLHEIFFYAGINQSYGNYSGSNMQANTGIMESRNSSMLPNSFNQSYPNPQTGPGMMGPSSIRNQQGQYIPQPNR